MEDQLEDVMERIRARQNEMSDVKENEVKKVITKQESLPPPSPTKVFGNSSRSNEAGSPKKQSFIKTTEPTPTTVNNDSTVNESNTTKKSRFSMLSANIDEYEVFDANNPFNKPKEAYMKGRSPRLSVGETRSSVLFTPAGQASMRNQNIAKTPPHSSGASDSKSAPNVISQSEFEARRIKFAQPIVNTHYLPNDSSVFSGCSSVNDMSTVLGGSAEMMNVTTSSLSCGEMSMNQQITHENTVINAQSCDNREAILRDRNVSTDEYGAHTFMRKKVPKQQQAIPEEQDTVRTPVTQVLSRPNYHALVSSPKPFSKEIGKSAFSPVHFTPKSTSSPKTKLCESAGVLSPSKSAALQGSVAKTRMMQFEQQLQKTNASVPMPSASAAPVPTPRHHVDVQPKKDTIVHNPSPHVQPEAVKPLPSGVQTQWRGQANTPVVQGARAEDKTAGDDVVGAGAGRLKNLKSRWEFCSATGTPIHPDATEDSLIATAIKMKETAIPSRFQIGYRPISGRKGPSASSIHSQPARSTTASPATKSPRFGYESEVFEDEQPEKNDEEPLIDSDESVHEEIPEGDTSRFIDHAFGFIEGGTTTPSPYRPLDGHHMAPLAKHDESGTPKRLGRKDFGPQIIEEEDVPVGDTDEEEDDRTECGDEETLLREASRVVEQHQHQQPQQQKERSSNDSSLPYSVSFYRKKQRERVGESAAPLTPIVPSAPVLSLTSPQKLKQLTSGHLSGGDYAMPPTGGRIMESHDDALDRLRRAIYVEEKHVQQSQRAMDLSRRDANFRGSRHEFEAQRAHLAHVEKYRALVEELKRLEREGPRIVDGPRGSLSVSSLAVRMAPEFAAYYSESNKSEEIFYFVAVLRFGEQVTVSQIVTSDDANNRRRALEFPSLPLQLTAIPPDFQATLEIYGQRAMREVKPKGATLKAKSTRNPFGSSSSANQSALNYTTSSSSTNFNLLGSFTFDINCPYKKDYKLSHYVHPLTGEVQMKIRKQTVDGADICHRGFMSMYQRDGKGVGSWTRYWCVLDNGELKFWKQPEDEGSKSWLVLLDLSTCCRSEGASPVNDICPFPNSFHIDVWVPRDDGAGSDATIGSRNDIEKLRVMLAADTQEDMTKWLSAINSTSKQLCTWRNPIH